MPAGHAWLPRYVVVQPTFVYDDDETLREVPVEPVKLEPEAFAALPSVLPEQMKRLQERFEAGEFLPGLDSQR